ncbi:MFS general substrate transporter [Linderina pennispora]|uniref:MFS general substrate transporter n=1 Tax=Linderina pennispora TaxID=61395 RepID=A0A1Y1WC64_9FUNG|nr:MFS general substrate transporter [Linderina pennispora]ORX70965.1 MFS general substrate transporter [Linderina pennispora]
MTASRDVSTSTDLSAAVAVPEKAPSSYSAYEQFKEHNLLGQPKWGLGKTLATFSGLCLVMYEACSAEAQFNQILAPLKDHYGSSIFAQWMEAAYLLTCVLLQPVWVKMAEKFGRPWPLFASILVFMAFSVMVGAAPSMGVLCVGRALQGAGAAGMMPLALVVLTDVLTPGVRGMYMGGLGAVIVAGKWSGPMVGAALYEYSNWRWVGYMHLPICAVAMVVLYATLHDMPTPPSKSLRSLREFDFLGTLLWVGGGLMILLALSWGGNEHKWNSAVIICLFVFGFVVVGLFGCVEAFYAKWPIIPLKVLFRKRTLLTLTSSFFLGFCIYGMIMFVPVYYMMLQAEGPLASAKHIWWCMLGGVIGSLLGGFLVSVRHRVYYRELSVVGTLLMAIGYGLLYTWPRELDKAKNSGYQVLVGLGLGLCMQQIMLAGQAGIPANEVSTVTTLIDYGRTLGGMVGLVMGEVILKEKMFATLDGQDVVGLEAMAPMLAKLPSVMTDPIYSGIMRALHLVFVAYVPFAAAACILCVFIKNIPLHVILPASHNDEVPEALRDLHRKKIESV